MVTVYFHIMPLSSHIGLENTDCHNNRYYQSLDAYKFITFNDYMLMNHTEGRNVSEKVT